MGTACIVETVDGPHWLAARDWGDWVGLVAHYCCSGAKVWLVLKHEQLETLW